MPIFIFFIFNILFLFLLYYISIVVIFWPPSSHHKTFYDGASDPSSLIYIPYIFEENLLIRPSGPTLVLLYHYHYHQITWLDVMGHEGDEGGKTSLSSSPSSLIEVNNRYVWGRLDEWHYGRQWDKGDRAMTRVIYGVREIKHQIKKLKMKGIIQKKVFSRKIILIYIYNFLSYSYIYKTTTITYVGSIK